MRSKFIITVGSLALIAAATPSLARDYSYSDRYDRSTSSDHNDNDRDSYERGYRTGRNDSWWNDRDRYGSRNSYRSRSSSMSDDDYDRGYRRGRDDERRSSSRDND